jgi:hypothetical protein
MLTTAPAPPGNALSGQPAVSTARRRGPMKALDNLKTLKVE